jgi:hypothetical protein
VDWGIVNGWSAFDQFLATDPRDVGCDQALQLLHVYVELIGDDGGVDSRFEAAARRYPGLAAHLAACGPCDEDFHGLLAAINTRW